MADRYRITYDREVVTHLKAIDRRFHPVIRQAIESHLAYEPNQATRNRKPLLRETTLGAAWELRAGEANQFRVFYNVEPEQRVVYVLAIGIKIRERLYIGGEEYPL